MLVSAAAKGKNRFRMRWAFFLKVRERKKRKKIIEVGVCVHMLCIKKERRRKRSLRWKVFILPWVAQSSCCSQGHQTDTLLFDI